MATPPIQPRALPTVLLSNRDNQEALRAGLRSGVLVRVRPGAYLPVVEDLPAWQQTERLALARAAALGPRLTGERVLSHATAALVHGLPVWQVDARAHLLQPYGSRGSPDLQPHVATVPPEDVTVVHGLPVTSLARTAEDCALTLHPRDALVIVDGALRVLGGADRFRLAETRPRVVAAREQLLGRLEQRRGTNGMRRARAVITFADGFAESAPESVGRWIALSRGLPPPTTQVRVVTAIGTYFVDMAWRLTQALGDHRHTRVVYLEIDGASKYLGVDVLHSGVEAGRLVFEEKRRQDAILEGGGVMHRLTTPDLRDAGSAFARLARAFPPEYVARLQPRLDLWPREDWRA